MSYKPTHREVMDALGVISGRIKQREDLYDGLREGAITDDDRFEAEDTIRAVLEYGWNK